VTLVEVPDGAKIPRINVDDAREVDPLARAFAIRRYEYALCQAFWRGSHATASPLHRRNLPSTV